MDKIHVIKKCEEVFEDPKAAAAWLRLESVALGGKTPFELMESEHGRNLVIDELGRIEHGIVS
jgi:putative toxin-antitoxin system antitoxin component (TIGR02293 family)